MATWLASQARQAATAYVLTHCCVRLSVCLLWRVVLQISQGPSFQVGGQQLIAAISRLLMVAVLHGNVGAQAACMLSQGCLPALTTAVPASSGMSQQKQPTRVGRCITPLCACVLLTHPPQVPWQHPPPSKTAASASRSQAAATVCSWLRAPAVPRSCLWLGQHPTPIGSRQHQEPPALIPAAVARPQAPLSLPTPAIPETTRSGPSTALAGCCRATQ